MRIGLDSYSFRYAAGIWGWQAERRLLPEDFLRIARELGLASVGNQIAIFDPGQMLLLDPIPDPNGGLTDMCRMPVGKVCGPNDKAWWRLTPVRGKWGYWPGEAGASSPAAASAGCTSPKARQSSV